MFHKRKISKNKLFHKPDSVFCRSRISSFICGTCRHGPLAAYPPAWASSPKPVYVALHPMRFTFCGVASGSCELLPHNFTLTPAQGRGGIISVALAVSPKRAFPLGSMVLCGVRTFLPLFKTKSDERNSLSQKYIVFPTLIHLIFMNLQDICNFTSCL